MDKNVVILDIGSGKLTIAVGHKTNSGIFIVMNFADITYSGYFNGQFVEPKLLSEDIERVIEKAGITNKYSTIYVGVPSAFTKVEANSCVVNYNHDKLITKSIIDSMHQDSNMFSDDYSHRVINSSAIDYIINGSYHTLNPIGKKVKNLRANLSYIVCPTSFCELLESCLRQNGFNKINFISSMWAIGSQLLDQDAKDKGSVIVDVGFANTSLGYVKGQGLDYVDSMSMGGGNIADDLAYAMDIDFEEAYEFFPRLNLNQDVHSSADYEVRTKNGIDRYGVLDVNEMVMGRLNLFADWINTQLVKMDKPLAPASPIYLTGGSLTSIRGAIGYLEKQIERRIYVLVPDLPQYNQPKYTSTIAMLDISSEINNSQSIWKKLFK